MEILERFIDEEGKIKQLPAKKESRIVVLAYLAEKFEAGRNYSEKEVNAIIESWHTFGDYFLLRRELIDWGLMRRERDGSRYWKEEQEKE